MPSSTSADNQQSVEQQDGSRVPSPTPSTVATTPANTGPVDGGCQRRGRGHMAKLQKIVYKRKRALEHLRRENEQLLCKEAVLLRCIAQQEGVLHTLGSMLSSGLVSELMATTTTGHDAPPSANEATLAALFNDCRARQLLETVIGLRGLPDSKQLYTTQRLNCAITSDRVGEVKAADVKKDIIPRMQDITMRVSLQLQHQSVQGQLSESLSESMDEYQELVLLLHTAADDKLLQLGTLNFDTLQEAQPPPRHWEAMTDTLQLTAEQTEDIAAGFHYYATRRADLIARMQDLAQQLQKLLGPQQPPPATGAAAATKETAALRRTTRRGTSQACRERENPVCEISKEQHSNSATSNEQLLATRLFDVADQGQGLLKQLDWINRAIREVDRMVVYQSANVLTKTQLACCIVHSYPFLCQPCAWAEVVFRRSQLYHTLHPHGE